MNGITIIETGLRLLEDGEARADIDGVVYDKYHWCVVLDTAKVMAERECERQIKALGDSDPGFKALLEASLAEMRGEGKYQIRRRGK